MDGLKRNYEYVENEMVNIRKSIIDTVHWYSKSENGGQGIVKSKLELLDKFNEQDADLCDTNNEFYMVLSELNSVINDGDKIIKNACKKYNLNLDDICKEVDVNFEELQTTNSKDKADLSINKTFDADKNKNLDESAVSDDVSTPNVFETSRNNLETPQMFKSVKKHLF